MASYPFDGNMAEKLDTNDHSIQSSFTTATQSENEAAERRLVRKIDLHLIPVLFVL